MMKTAKSNGTTIMALDVGGRRIGVARANIVARLPEPLVTLVNDDQIFIQLNKLVKEEQVAALIIGLPRGMNGQETEQTKITRNFSARLQQHISIPVYLQDESLTSRQAEQELQKRGQYHDKAMVDALAATYILEDFLRLKNPLKEL